MTHFLCLTLCDEKNTPIRLATSSIVMYKTSPRENATIITFNGTREMYVDQTVSEIDDMLDEADLLLGS